MMWASCVWIVTVIIKFLYQFSIGKQAAVDDSSNLSQTSSEELPEASEKNRYQPPENLKGKLIHYCM